MGTLFHDDHHKALGNSEYAGAHAEESARISAVDYVINMLNDEIEKAGVSKSALARAIGANPAAVRRLLSASGVNPTLATVSDIASALGLKVELIPTAKSERKHKPIPALVGA
jgi:DNA-binding phage protein